MAELKQTVFTSDILSEVIGETVAEWEKLKATRQTARPAVEADLKKLEGELAKYAAAIADAGPLPSLLDQITVREWRPAELEQRLRQLDAAEVAARIPSAGDVRRRVERRLEDWWRLFERHPQDARQQVLCPLFGGRRLVLTPQPVGRTYDFRIQLTWDAIITGLVGAPTDELLVLPPRGP